MRDFRGRTAFITGGASGIGLGIFSMPGMKAMAEAGTRTERLLAIGPGALWDQGFGAVPRARVRTQAMTAGEIYRRVYGGAEAGELREGQPPLPA